MGTKASKANSSSPSSSSTYYSLEEEEELSVQEPEAKLIKGLFTAKPLSDENHGEDDPTTTDEQSLREPLSPTAVTGVGSLFAATHPSSSLHWTPSPATPPPPPRIKLKTGDARTSSPSPVTTDPPPLSLPTPRTVTSYSEAPSPPSVSSTHLPTMDDVMYNVSYNSMFRLYV